MRRSLIVACVIMFAQMSWGQAYKTGLGFKGGYPGYGGINLKHDFGGLFGDFTLGGGANYFTFTALAEKQTTLQGNFDWYVGGGVYVNSWRNSYYYKDHYYNHGAAFGIVGVLGIEYTFEGFPLNLGVDVGPVVNFAPYFGVGFGGNFAARYVIN